MEKQARRQFSRLVLLFLAILAISTAILPGFSACPSGYYPDPTDSNCKQGVPYSVSISHKALGEGKLQFDISVTSLARETSIGISSSSEFVVPYFSYVEGGSVQLGDYAREGTTSSVAKGSCGIYPLRPGETVKFSTVASFKPSQEGREILVSADNINWMALPSFPTCTIGAQGRETRVGSDKFTFRYSANEPSVCSGEGASCSGGKVCCDGFYCAANGFCAKLSGSSQEGSQDGSSSSQGSSSYGTSQSEGLGGFVANNAVILGILIGVVIIGGVGYFLFGKGRGNGEDETHSRHGHHKK